MRLLVLGANGLLGSNVVNTGRERGFDVVGTYHSSKPNFEIPLTQFDIRDADAFQGLLDRYKPDTVVNCAAMTDVDACEETPELAHAINGDAPESLVKCCIERNMDFVHVSTDYVFDGNDTSPYDEMAQTNPVQVYGESKLEGERSIRNVDESILIPRLSFVYGIHRDTNELTGFPAWVRNRLENGDQTSLFSDQRITPTRAGNAAGTILDLLNANVAGLYHIACRSCVTPYKFGLEIQNRLGIDSRLLSKGSQDDVDRSAVRPSNTCLDISSVEHILNRSQPTLEDDLDEIETTAF